MDWIAAVTKLKTPSASNKFILKSKPAYVFMRVAHHHVVVAYTSVVPPLCEQRCPAGDMAVPDFLRGVVCLYPIPTYNI